MTEQGNYSHPALDSLLAFAEGKLALGPARAVADHLTGCVLCGLEIKRYRRFDEAPADLETARDAQWDRAELQLAGSWRQEIKPALAADPGSAIHQGRWLWLLPAAAAAMAAFFLLQPAAPPVPGSGPEVFRGGGEAAAPTITLQSPQGEMKALPDGFTWQTDQQCDEFTLEIFTADLESVYTVEEIEAGSWLINDELAELLKPDTIYLWSVTGYHNLGRAAESGSGWFTLKPDW